MTKKNIAVFAASLWAMSAIANDGEVVTMADAMRSNGKIYVVVAVLLTVLIGLFIYLWRIDRRLRKLEKNQSLN